MQPGKLANDYERYKFSRKKIHPYIFDPMTKYQRVLKQPSKKYRFFSRPVTSPFPLPPPHLPFFRLSLLTITLDSLRRNIFLSSRRRNKVANRSRERERERESETRQVIPWPDDKGKDDTGLLH